MTGGVGHKGRKGFPPWVGPIPKGNVGSRKGFVGDRKVEVERRETRERRGPFL